MNKKRLLLTIIVVCFIVFLVVILLFNNSTLVCRSSFDQSDNGYVVDTKYLIKYCGNEVKKVIITEIITSDDKKILKDFSNQHEKQYLYNKKMYGGYFYKITNKKNKLTSYIEINYKKLNMKKFIHDNAAMKDFVKDNKLTVDGAKRLYESTGARCNK